MMSRNKLPQLTRTYLLCILLLIALAACNLGAAPAEPVDITSAPTSTIAPTRTLLPNLVSTPITITPIINATQQVIPRPATAFVVVQPTAFLPPVNTATPISIFILSPTNGNIIAGNIQVLGSAIHPNFLQYRLEFGPDPNPGNLWFPITGIVQTPILNGILGVWNTNTPSSPDGVYQIRLRVILRDGTEQTTVVNNIRVRNQSPTPQPTNTPQIAPPVAAFTQDVTSGEAPLVVKFTNLSQGEITSKSWSFGDGGSSNRNNPTYTFQNPGLYTVRLTVTGPGGTANVSRQINVKSASAPIASFTTNTTSGTSPLTVNFTNTSTGNITERLWNFGDGATSSDNNPTHTFTDVGTYNVILEVRGPGGISKAIRQITVENPTIPPPTAAFTPSLTSGQPPLTVQFTNETQGDVTTYLWDFNGDGITDSVDENPTHVYNTAGTYTVVLTVIGPGGQSNANAQISVENPPNAPIADFDATPLTGTAPLTVSFSNTTSGDTSNFSWDFNNDGVIDSTETSPTFTYSEAGTYTAKLTATGPGGATTAEATITVTTPLAAPEAAFNANPTNGDVPIDITFTNESNGDQLSYSWDFDGDGLVDSTEAGPHTITFTNAGTFNASLTVSNSVGSDTATVQLILSEAVAQVPPTAAFTPSVTSGTAPLTVSFTNTSSGDFTNSDWDFNGDGITDSTETNPSFTFNDPGTFTVSLTVSGPAGSNSTAATITVNPPALPPLEGELAFISDRSGNNDIYLSNLDGSNVVNATEHPANDREASWSPDGSKIAFVSDRDGNDEIYVLNLSDRTLTRLTNNGESDTSPVWSPDGSKIAFVSNRFGDNDLFVMDVDGSNQIQLVSDTSNDNSPTWSPDGTQIAFVSDRSGNNDIYVLNVSDGSIAATLTSDGANDRMPAWSPNGSRIAFVSDRSGNNEIYSMSAIDGSDLVQLTNDGANDRQPSWTSDNNHIYFASDRITGEHNIYRMNASDGADVTPITSDGSAESQPKVRP